MARKSRKVDFVNTGSVADNTISTMQESRTETKVPVFKAGLYARLSLESEANKERNTVETQMELLKKFVDQTTDIVVEKEYFDISKTGTDFERSGFDEMMQDIRNNRINCVIVKDLSRLGRNYVEAGNYIERVFPFFEVRFIAVTDGYDSEKGEAGLAVCMSNIFNEYYSRDLGKKIKAAARSNWAKGRCVAGNLVYGLKKDPDDKYRIIHDEETVGNVVRMFDMFLAGATYAEIAAAFNKEGLLNPKAYKHFKRTGQIPDTFDIRWLPGSIPPLLSNRYYTGDSVHGQHSKDSFREKKQQPEPEENWIIVENTHEPVIAKEVFEQTQSEMERRRAEHKAAKNPGKYSVADRNFFGKKIVCADCGKTMYLHRGGAKGAVFKCGSYVLKKQCLAHKVYDTEVYNQVLKVIHTKYRCSHAHQGGMEECKQNKINRKQLNNLILNCTKEMVNFVSADLKNRKKQWSESNRLSEEMENLRNEKSRLSTRKFTIYDDYRNGNSSREKYLRNLEMIQERIAEIDVMIPELEQQIKEANKKLEEVREKESTLSDIAALQTFDQDVLLKVLEKVYVYGPDKVELVWRTDDIFFCEEIPEKREVINPAELTTADEKQRA